MLDKAQNSKTLSNCQTTYQKELYLPLEKSGNFFLQSERTDRLEHPLPLFVFVRFLNDSPTPSTANVFLNAPFPSEDLLLINLVFIEKV